MQLKYLQNQESSAVRGGISIHPRELHPSLPKDTPAVDAAPDAARRVGGPLDQVSLSNPALSYAAAYRAVAAAAWVRPDRVEALKAAIDDDSYEVSSLALASAMSGKA